jgi:hypothetical protein
MNCKKCNTPVNEDQKFCPECGNKNPAAIHLATAYKNSYGLWQVDTEGDCEGRTSKQLGKFFGHMDEIALFLADRCFYSLTFKKVSDDCYDFGSPTKNGVYVTLDIASNTWDMDREHLSDVVGEMLKDRPVEVTEGKYYASVYISGTK